MKFVDHTISRRRVQTFRCGVLEQPPVSGTGHVGGVLDVWATMLACATGISLPQVSLCPQRQRHVGRSEFAYIRRLRSLARMIDNVFRDLVREGSVFSLSASVRTNRTIRILTTTRHARMLLALTMQDVRFGAFQGHPRSVQAHEHAFKQVYKALEAVRMHDNVIEPRVHTPSTVPERG